ncbi:hypothetical protein BH23CHL2_BH23CHL2_23480 [soil metagenome]
MQTYKGDAELATLLDAAVKAGEPLRIVVNGTTYDIVVQGRDTAPDPWADYDPDAALEALENSAGVLGGIDADALIAELKAEREQDSPGRSS